ncbi:MAG: hypothetical protein F4X26_00740 [Chloroflexi bacterium]|nr:hypothetical protein [Chloroflexota bacterium]
MRALVFVLTVVMMLAVSGCEDCECPDAPQPTAAAVATSTPEPTATAATEPTATSTPTPPATASPEPAAEARGFADLDVDELDIPLLSDSELEANLRSVPGVAPAVTVEGSSIVYSGGMHPDGYDALVQLGERGEVSELVISSLGGEVYWGMKIGEVVHENGWDVRVRGLCFSSCANYIFPAGQQKVIEEGAVVGWHGSARQSQFFAEQQGTSGRQQIADSISLALQQAGGNLTQEALTEAVIHNIALSETRIELERAFYERIGVDSDISVYGFFPQHLGSLAGAGGWTFILEDMAKFGLDDVIYEGSEVYPSEGGRALLDLALIRVDDR